MVLEVLKEQKTIKELCHKHELAPQQLNAWKREFLSNAEPVFEKGSKSKKSEAELLEERYLKTIGQQKMEIDFLKKALS